MDSEPTETIILNADAADVVRQMLGLYDAPAYVRRALETEGAIASVWRRCETQRAEWLQGVRRHWGRWRLLAAAEPRWAANLSEAARAALAALPMHLAAENCVVPPWACLPRLGPATANLARSIARFNRRWTTFVTTLDFTAVNQLIDGYNRHYVLEKECVVGSARLAAHGFVPLAPLTPQQLLERWPPLPELPLD